MSPMLPLEATGVKAGEMVVRVRSGVTRHLYMACLSTLLVVGVACFFCTTGRHAVHHKLRRSLPKLSYQAPGTSVGYPCGCVRDSAMPTSHEMPRRIWQTYRSRKVPKEALGNMQQWVTANPGWDLYFCDDGEVRRLFEIMGQPYLKAYDDMPLGVMRADFWRYAVLHKYGGLYVDMDVKERLPLDSWVPHWKAPMAVLGLENDVHFCQWACFSTPGHPLLKIVLDLIVAQVQRGIVIHEHMVHDTTGPAIWTEAIKQYLGPAAQSLSPPEILVRPGLWFTKRTMILSEESMLDGLIVHGFGSVIWADDKNYVSWLHNRRSVVPNP